MKRVPLVYVPETLILNLLILFTSLMRSFGLQTAQCSHQKPESKESFLICSIKNKHLPKTKLQIIVAANKT